MNGKIHTEIKAQLEKSGYLQTVKEARICSHLIHAKKYDEAVSRIKEILAETKSPAAFFLLLSEAYHGLNDAGKALDAIEQAIVCKPEEPLFHAWKGLLHLRVNNLEDAAECAQKAVELSPGCGFAHYVYGRSLLKQRRLEEAETHLLEAYRKLHYSPLVDIHLGKIYLARNDFLKARDHFRRAVAEEPGEHSLLGSMIIIEESLGNLDESVEAGERLIASYPDPVMHFYLEKIRARRDFHREIDEMDVPPCGPDRLAAMLEKWFVAASGFIRSRVPRADLERMSTFLSEERMFSLLVHVNRFSPKDFKLRTETPRFLKDPVQILEDRATMLGMCAGPCDCVERYREAHRLVEKASRQAGYGCLDWPLVENMLLLDYSCRDVYQLLRASQTEGQTERPENKRANNSESGQAGIQADDNESHFPLTAFLSEPFTPELFFRAADMIKNGWNPLPARLCFPLLLNRLQLQFSELEDTDFTTQYGEFCLPAYRYSYKWILDKWTDNRYFKRSTGAYFLLSGGPEEIFGHLLEEMKQELATTLPAFREKWAFIKQSRKDKQEKLKRILSQLKLLPLSA